MNEALSTELRDTGLLGEPLEALQGGVTGFVHAHAVTVDALPVLAETFRRHDYFLEMLTCLDLRQNEQRMRLVYTFNCFSASDRYRLHIDLAPTKPWSGPAAKPARGKAKAKADAEEAAETKPATVELPVEVPSLTSMFGAADWFEREVFDMFGVRFAGHPQLERLLLPEDADFHALLKDFGRMDAVS